MTPIRLFYSYSTKDESLRRELDNHLMALQRAGAIETWASRAIMPGTRWREEIDAALGAADVILLLISADFIASDYCWQLEMREALRREAKGEAIVVPILLRDCDWEITLFAHLQFLPATGIPVARKRPRDRAWTEIARALRQRIEKLQSNREATAIVPQTRLVNAILDAGTLAGAAELLNIPEADAMRSLANHGLTVEQVLSSAAASTERMTHRREQLIDALRRGGSFSGTCEILGIGRLQLYEELMKHQLSLLSVAS